MHYFNSSIIYNSTFNGRYYTNSTTEIDYVLGDFFSSESDFAFSSLWNYSSFNYVSSNILSSNISFSNYLFTKKKSHANDRLFTLKYLEYSNVVVSLCKTYNYSFALVNATYKELGIFLWFIFVPYT